MALSISQMERMSRLLDEALALDETGRRAWLERTAQAHSDLAAALREALLPGAGQAANLDALVSLPKFGPADEADAAAASGLKPGELVGPYELIRRLGAGGMAEVWLARRADGAFKREVALKLPMRARLDAGLAARFARERDILASLEHPNIARLYDAGVDPHGLPYLSMEYVQGEPLTDWCDARRLGITERVALVLQVLEAVQYAHAKQVMHRDLKPSNILVTDSGQVRLLDFGVARLLEAETTDQTALTSIYGRALTPDYASPELLRGDPIDARSDLYSLGVLLYELLTGTRPYRLKTAASIGLLDQAIARVEVNRPSQQLEQAAATSRNSTVEQLARQLRGDLDAIVLMALAKEPAQRYPTAAALGEDLRRYLADRPVRARPARIAYRLDKFVRRHGTLLGVGAVAVVAITAALGYALYRDSHAQVTVSAKAPAVPAAPASTADVVADFAPPAHSIAVLPFIDMSEKKDEEYFADGMAEEIIDLLVKLPGLKVSARTSSFYFKGKPTTITEIARELGVAQVLEGSVRTSGRHLRVTAQLVSAANGYHLWSETYDRHLEDVFKTQDEIAGAVVAALKLKLAPGQQATSSHRTSNPDAYNQYLLGRQFFERFDLDGFRRAVDAYRKAIELDPNYAAAYAELAVSEYFVGDWTGDIAQKQQALVTADKAVALAPAEGDGYGVRGYLRTEFAWDWTGAQSDFEKALELNPGDNRIPRRYGQLLASLGRLPESIAVLEKATELDPLSSLTWTVFGTYLIADRQFAAAEKALRRALEIQPDSGFALARLGEVELLMGDPTKALTTFRKRGSSASGLTGVAMAEHSLGHVKESQHSLDEAIANHAQDSAYQIATAYAWREEKDNAFAWLERAFQQREGGLTDINDDALLNSLRGDNRFSAMLKKMRLPE